MKLSQPNISCCSGSEVDGGVFSIVTTGKKRKAATSSGRGGKKAKLSATVNPLDQTCIHPESYEITERFVFPRCFPLNT